MFPPARTFAQSFTGGLLWGWLRVCLGPVRGLRFPSVLFRIGNWVISGVLYVLTLFLESSLRFKTLQNYENIWKTLLKGDFGTALGRCKNATGRRQYQYVVYSFAKNTRRSNTVDCSLSRNSVDFGQTWAPERIYV